MRALWTAAAAARATGGRPVGQWAATGVSIDTRTLEAGDLFVPLKDVRDGHDFIPQAFERGAAAVLSERDVRDVPALIVEDTLVALQELGRAAGRRANAKRIAVTGSVGKTSLKELLAAMCAGAGPTHKSVKSYNNHWGVPLSLARMPEETRYGVFEAGMNHKGELSELSKLIRPEIAIITKIAPAHLAHFNSLEDIASAKAEIIDGLKDGGSLILPEEARTFRAFHDLPERLTVRSFGCEQTADARILEARQTVSGSKALIRLDGQTYEVNIPLPGAHWVENVTCALLAAKQAGITIETALNALTDFKKLPGRGASMDIDLGGRRIHLIDESYNANPESMRAAIAVLGLAKGRKIAVLGDMLELGDGETDLHVGLAGPLQEAEIDGVFLCGPRMQALADALPKSGLGGWAPDWQSCLDLLLAGLEDGDTLMVKGSNASGMGALVAALKAKHEMQGDLHVV